MLSGLDGGRCPQVLHGTRVWYHEDWQQNLAALGLADMANWRTPVDVPSVSSSQQVVACYRIVLASGRIIYYKRYDYREYWQASLRFWLRPSKAAVEKWGYQRYQACGVDVPLTIAYGESRFLGFLRAAFIITEEVPEAVSLADFVAAGLPGVAADSRIGKLNAFAVRLVECISKAHRACVFHYDLKWRNILVQTRDGEFYPVFIDCPRAFVSCLRRSYGIVTDMSALARLAVSYLTLGQRYRFLAACLGKQADAADRKAWYRRIQRRLDKRLPKMVSLQRSPLQGVRFDDRV